mgnify:CR=1 FL=1
MTQNFCFYLAGKNPLESSQNNKDTGLGLASNHGNWSNSQNKPSNVGAMNYGRTNHGNSMFGMYVHGHTRVIAEPGRGCWKLFIFIFCCLFVFNPRFLEPRESKLVKDQENQHSKFRLYFELSF